MKTKILIGAGLGALAATLPVAAIAQPVPGAVIAVIDSDRIQANCTACLTALTQLRAQAQQLETRTTQLATPLQTEGRALETEQQALQTAVSALPAGTQPDAALNQRIQAFSTRQQAFQRNREAAETEIGRSRQTLQRNAAYVREQIGTAISAATPDVMRARGANIAVDRAATIAIAPTVDVTDAVLAAVNARLTTINTTAPAPAATPGGPAATPTAPVGPAATPTTPRPRPRGR